MDEKKIYEKGVTIYVRADVIGTITGMNSGIRYQVILPDGNKALIHEKDVKADEPR